MPFTLLYNLSGKPKTQKLRFVLAKLGLRAREVKREELGQPVGFLAGLDGFQSTETYEGEGFSDEMLVMCGLADAQIGALLTALRQARVPVALKAVLTEENAGWSSLQLHEELCRERDALEGKAPGDAESASVHGKK